MQTMRALCRGQLSVTEMPMEMAATITEGSSFDEETILMSEEELNDGRSRSSTISFERHVDAVWKEMLALVNDDKGKDEDNDAASVEISSSSSFRLPSNGLIPGRRDSSFASLFSSSASTMTSSSSSSSLSSNGRQRRASVLGCIQDEIIRKGIAEGKLIVSDDGKGSIDNEYSESEDEDCLRSNEAAGGGSSNADASSSAIASAAAAHLHSFHPSHDAQHQHYLIPFPRGAPSSSLLEDDEDDVIQNNKTKKKKY